MCEREKEGMKKRGRDRKEEKVRERERESERDNRFSYETLALKYHLPKGKSFLQIHN